MANHEIDAERSHAGWELSNIGRQIAGLHGFKRGWIAVESDDHDVGSTGRFHRLQGAKRRWVVRAEDRLEIRVRRQHVFGDRETLFLGPVSALIDDLDVWVLGDGLV